MIWRKFTYLPEETLLLAPPRGVLLARLLVIWLFLFLTLVGMDHLFTYLAVPALVVLVHYYRLFLIQWKRYQYAPKLLHGATVVMMLCTIAVADRVRSLIAFWVQGY